MAPTILTPADADAMATEFFATAPEYVIGVMCFVGLPDVTLHVAYGRDGSRRLAPIVGA